MSSVCTILTCHDPGIQEERQAHGVDDEQRQIDAGGEAHARGEHEGLVGPGREDVRVVVTRARDPAVATREQCKDRS